MRELDAIRARHWQMPARGGSEDIAVLLAEVDRLRERVEDIFESPITASLALFGKRPTEVDDHDWTVFTITRGYYARRVRAALAEADSDATAKDPE